MSPVCLWQRGRRRCGTLSCRPRTILHGSSLLPFCVLSVAVLASGGDARRTPAFTLEEFVNTRTLGQFVLSPDRSRVVFTRVGRYFGHPLFPAFGEDSNLTILSLATGEQLQVTTGSAAKTYPAFSPEGQRIAFESEGDIWSVDLRTGAVRRLTTHVATDRSPVWSPDGRQIAFVSSRWGRVDLYVMNERGEREGLRRITNDEEGESWPVWSPDGRFILFTGARDEHFYSRGIYRVSASGGAPERITPPDDARNAWPVFSPDGNRIAYVSDRSGFLNLWSMAPDGTDQRQICRTGQDQDYPENEFLQTMGPRWSPDGTRLLYFTNRLGNLDLMVVEVSTGRTAVVSDRDGAHHPVGWIDGSTVAYVYESYSTPPDLHVKTLEDRSRPGGEVRARRLTYSGRAAYQPDHFERLESVSWTSEDGVRVHGYLRRPRQIRVGERLPGLVVSHTYNFGQFYNQWAAPFSYLVQSGYVLLTVNHRGSSGYGVAFRDLPKGDWGFAQLKDIASGRRFLQSVPEVDGARIGMLGYSMGGYLTQLALTTRPELFKVGVAVFGLGEITGDPARSSRNYVWHIGGTEAERPEEYRHRSPVTHVANVRAPMLIIHSDGDPIEPVTKVRNFAYEMEKYGKTQEVIIYPNEGHGLRQLEHQLDSYRRVMAFLERYLKN
jgi:dipeptidyl aminopeptidase/acylaminoacyl peptidase